MRDINWMIIITLIAVVIGHTLLFLHAYNDIHKPIIIEKVKYVEKTEYVISYIYADGCIKQKFIDDLRYPACKEWCNKGEEYDWSACYWNCQSEKVICN